MYFILSLSSNSGHTFIIPKHELQVLPAVASVRGNEVVFQDGKSHPFDVIIFATGFKRSTNKWLKAINTIYG